MAHAVLRRKRTVDPINLLGVTTTAAAIVHDVATLLAFPPLSAASGILLSIFKTIEVLCWFYSYATTAHLRCQTLRNNRDECLRVAKRCAGFIQLIAKHTHDLHVDNAPEELLRNIADFER